MADNKVKWTPEQIAAINHDKGGAIVDANAGAGKTAVLTTRIVDMLSSEEKETDPAGLVIITFTKKAAAELKTRLNKKMRERIAQYPEKADFLRKQCARLHKARISTISSFCFSLIRENIGYCDLAPGFTIMEEARARMMRYAVTELAIENFYRNADKSDLQLILDHFAGKSGDKALIEAIMDINGYAENLPDPDGWYSLCKDASRLDDILNQSYNEIKSRIAELKDACQELDEAYNELCGMEKARAAQNKALLKADLTAKNRLPAFISFFKEQLELLTDALAKDDFSGIKQLDKNEIKKAIPSFTKGDIGTYNPQVSYAAAVLETAHTNIKYLAIVKSRLMKGQPVIDILTDIAQETERLYKAEKSALNVADYSDAERQLYNMVTKYPIVKEKAGIELLIVDEFQDSNRLQYEIFRALSDSESNLYFVGDMKQSIYAFRGAQSEVFDEVTKNPLYTHLYLNHNFRSRDNVIDSINDIFCPVMTEKLGGVDYKKHSQLILGNDKNLSTDPADVTEVIVVTDEKKDSPYGNTEADYVAYRINKMIQSGYTVEGRPCKAEDFAILLRSSGDKAPVFACALADYGIRSVTKGDGKLFSEPETVIMTDYLRVIDDPYNDESLARLLMSCLFGFSADDMAAVRTCTLGFDIKAICEFSADCEEELKAYVKLHQRTPLYSCIKKAVSGYRINEEYSPALAALYKEQPALFGAMTDDRCILFEKELDRLRGIMAAVSPAQLIKHIYDTTATADLLTVGEGAENRRLNLMTILSMAEEYDKYHSGGILSEFLGHLSEMERQGQKTEASSDTAKSGVQIMSIHASKGLEFPIVFVCDCAKRINTEDATKQAVMSDSYGICIRDVDKANMAKIPSPAYEITAEKIVEKLRSEEMRLLYVAATRAMYKLIFTSKSETDDLPTDEMSEEDRLTHYKAWVRTHLCGDKTKAGYDNKRVISELSGKSSYLAWLNVALFTDKSPRIDYRLISLADEKENDIKASESIGDAETKEVVADRTVTDTIKNQITAQYSHPDATRLAAKYTATGLAAMKRQDKDKKCELYVAKPSFARDKGKLSGKKRGDAYHKLMEHIPFEKPLTEQEVASFIADRTADFLSDAERDCIKPSDISGFFLNDITARMLKSGRIYREHPIFHRLSADIMAEIDSGYDVTESPYVQGIADMFFIEDDGIVLIDYKTDSFSDEEKLSGDYAFQLKVYEEALETAFSLPVKEKYIYSFKMGKMIKL